MKTASRSAELALLGVTVVWGATFTLVKGALEDVSTLLFLTLRFTAGAAMMAALLRPSWSGSGPALAAGTRGGLIAGLCLAAAYFLQTAGLRLTTPTHSAFLTALCVVLVPFFGALVYRVVPRWMEGLGVGLALVGTALLTSPFEGSGFSTGDLLSGLCAVAFAFHILAMGAFAPRADFARLSVMQLAIVAVLGILTCWWAEPMYVRWTPRLFFALAVTSVLCTAAGYTVQAWAQQRTSATRAALIFSLEPVSAATTSYAIDGEPLAGPALWGAALILAGVLVVELKPNR
ncbi:MAG: DMT family transporter [Bryobacteraceae bacterium]